MIIGQYSRTVATLFSAHRVGSLVRPILPYNIVYSGMTGRMLLPLLAEDSKLGSRLRIVRGNDGQQALRTILSGLLQKKLTHLTAHTDDTKLELGI